MGQTDLDTRISAFDDLVADVRQAFLQLEIGRCDLDQLATVKASVNRLRNMCDAARTDIAVRADQLRRADANDVVDPVLNPDGRESPEQEAQERDRGGVLDNLPGMDDATRSGDLPAVYADIIAKAVSKLSVEQRGEFYARHADLADLASKLGQRQFRQHVLDLVQRLLFDLGVQLAERQRRQRRASTFTEFDTGMWGLSGRWDPLAGERMEHAIRDEINAIYRTRRNNPGDTRTRDQITADAICNLICGTTVHQRAPRGATVIVITDQQTVRDGPHDGSVHEYSSGSAVAFDTLTALLDDSDTDVVEAIVNEHGIVTGLGDEQLDHGRTRRFATAGQKLALRVMYRTCIYPGCDIPFDACEQHHTVEWEHHGRTDLVDLGPTCSRHHHQLHAHDWKLRFHPDTRELSITYPDGTTRTHPYTGLAPPATGPPGDRESGGGQPATEEPVDGAAGRPRAAMPPDEPRRGRRPTPSRRRPLTAVVRGPRRAMRRPPRPDPRRVVDSWCFAEIPCTDRRVVGVAGTARG
jgi:hypothetical protein